MARADSNESASGGLWEMLRVVIHALVLVLLLRTFLYQPFSIPSQSMMPTLVVGDWLFVSKFTYGYSKYSFPLGYDLFSGRIWSGDPKPGDVVVFKLPRDNSTDYIKRLIGMPGDTIQMKAGVLHINGKPVEMRKIEDWTGPAMACDSYAKGGEIKIARYIETLPNGVSHEVLDCARGMPSDNTELFTVPPGHYFMMGDNRDNSADSRLSRREGAGFVPAENLIGRAEILYFSIEPTGSFLAPWRWPGEIRWSRLLKVVR